MPRKAGFTCICPPCPLLLDHSPVKKNTYLLSYFHSKHFIDITHQEFTQRAIVTAIAPNFQMRKLRLTQVM